MSTPTEAQSQVSRPLLIVLAVVAVLAVAYLAVAVLGSSADDEIAAGDPTEAASAAPGDAAVPGDPDDGPDEDPSEIGAVEPTFEVFDARDPFEQLVSDDVGSDPVGTTQPVSDTTPTDGATPVDGSTPTSTAPGAPGGTSSVATVGSTTILLDDVYRADGVRTALVVVDGQGFDATKGETVAGKVTVLDIAGNCATMRLGDKRFILCEGEQITK